MQPPLQHDGAFWAHLESSTELDPRLVASYRWLFEEREWQPLGAILVRLGHLGPEDVQALLAHQEVESARRFGELVLAAGPLHAGRARARALAPAGGAARSHRAEAHGPTRLDEDALLDAVARYGRTESPAGEGGR